MDSMIRSSRVHKLGFSSSPPTAATRKSVQPRDRRRGSGVLVRSSYNNYSVLGLTPVASKDDVKSAYRRLALKYHPDVVRGANGAGENQQNFLEIKSAYENLMDSYDRKHQRKYVEKQAPVKTARRRHDEWDDWDEWMGFEGATRTTYHAYY